MDSLVLLDDESCMFHWPYEKLQLALPAYKGCEAQAPGSFPGECQRQHCGKRSTQAME